MLRTFILFNRIIEMINPIYFFFGLVANFETEIYFHRSSMQSTFQRRYVVFLSESGTILNKYTLAFLYS
jgi:hypothetical protein